MIEVESLEKTFRVHRKAGGGLLGAFRREVALVRAVSGVSFTVGAGEMVGYVGPNGAGKSTTIKMLTGILQPSGGLMCVDGLDPARQRRDLARRIGVVFGQRTQLWWDLPLIDSFELLRHIYRVSEEAYSQRLARFTAMLELGPFLQTPVRQLSLGQRMRGDLAAALLHDPPILYLDEPTIGLDVVAIRRGETTAARVVAAVAASARLRDLTVEEPAIEDIVRRIYEGTAALPPAPSPAAFGVAERDASPGLRASS